MPDSPKPENEKQQPAVVLIAHLQAHLVTGEIIELIPVRNEQDVKTPVTELIKEWAESGFLLRGNIAYPWHQVLRVEVTRIDELTPREAHQRMLELEGAARAQMQKGFWKTRDEQKNDKDGGKEDKKEQKDGK